MILRKNHSPVIVVAVHKDGMWVKWPTKELNENTVTFVNIIRKSLLIFYGHLYWINDDKLIKQIFNTLHQMRGNKPVE